jgi:hypothetical protein
MSGHWARGQETIGIGRRAVARSAINHRNLVAVRIEVLVFDDG